MAVVHYYAILVHHYFEMDIIGKQSGELAANQIKIDDSTQGKRMKRRTERD